MPIINVSGGPALVVRVGGTLVAANLPAILPVSGYNYTSDNYTLTPGNHNADGCIGSMWFKYDGAQSPAAAFQFMVHCSNGRWYVDLTNGTTITVRMYNPSTVLIQNFTSTPNSAWLTDDAWHHVMFSRLGTTAHLYIDGVEDKAVHSTNSAGDFDVDINDWWFGGNHTSGFPFKGCLSNVYVNFGEYLDLSVEANRAKFITSGGEPVDPGADGSAPTGTSPQIWVPNGLPTTNAGTEGNFTLDTGDGAVAC